MSELLGHETPAEIEAYWRDRRAREARESAERVSAEQARLSQPPPPAPKDPERMTPAELQAHRAAQAEREREDGQEKAEAQRKDRARRAYVASTGSEEGFEGVYTASLRKKMVEQETLRALEREDVPVGTVTEEGVRW